MAQYSDEEVDEILRRALARQQKDTSGISHDDLVAAAKEVGIERADVEAAVAELRGSKAPAGQGDARAATPVDPDAALYLRDRQSRRARFARHFATYVVVNAALAGMNFLTGGTWWVLWVILGWGIGLGLQGLSAFLPDDPQRKENRMRRLRRRRDREERRDHDRARRRQRLTRNKERSREFEAAVQEGLGLLMKAAAHKIEDSIEKGRREREGVRVAIEDQVDEVRVAIDEEEAQAREPGARRGGTRKT